MNTKVWAMLILLSILWGGSFFFVGVAVNNLPPLTIVTLRVGIAAFTLWGIAIIGLAVASTAIAYVLYFRILELAGATNVLLVTLLVPVSAVLLGSLFLNESLEMIHFGNGVNSIRAVRH
ncbi:EamA family transporter [uncultured Vibrio sp.]|nr:EamA family transporter [uncultured Vibrio sp.]